MPKVNRNCFICSQVSSDPQITTDPNLSSCSPGRTAKNVFILLQRVLGHSTDLAADHSEIFNRISLCKLCLVELELTQNVLDAFDNMKKVADSHVREIQSKFLASKVQDKEGNGKSGRDLEQDGVAELRSQMVAGLKSRSRSISPAMTTVSPRTPGIFKRITRTRTKVIRFSRQATPSTSQKISTSANVQMSSSSVVPLGVRNDLNGEDDVLNTFDVLNCEQRTHTSTPVPIIKASRSGNRKMNKVSNEHASSSTQQLSPKKKKTPKNPSIPKINPQAKPSKHKKKHKCQLCPARFNSKSQLAIHFRVHTGQKPFSCQLCPKSFSQKGNLKSHQLIHSGEKPFRCKFCSKTVARLNHLKLHERVHTGEKPHLCKICRKTFAQSGLLVSHIRTHTKEKPYSCRICSKTFSQHGNLVVHMRSHTREKPFKCRMCSNSFSQYCDLVSHMRSHTGEKPFKCTVCSKEFAHASNFRRHKRTHNPTEARLN